MTFDQASIFQGIQIITILYTTALLKENNSTNQLTVLTLIVNTALIGNYSTINVGVPVTGILNPGTYMGKAVNLLPYFDGSLKSTNRGNVATAVSFLDDGGADPLKMNKPSAGNTTSNQYMLITHLYSFFGVLAGCEKVGTGAFPAYSGDTDMYSVHKYMDLDPTELGYFITQVGTAAASFGVSTADVNTLGGALNLHFGNRCGPMESIISGSPVQDQSICQDASCPVAPNATCAGIANGTEPTFTNGTNFSSPTSTGTGSGSGTGTATSKPNGAGLVEVGGVLGLAALVALAVV